MNLLFGTIRNREIILLQLLASVVVFRHLEGRSKQEMERNGTHRLQLLLCKFIGRQEVKTNAEALLADGKEITVRSGH